MRRGVRLLSVALAVGPGVSYRLAPYQFAAWLASHRSVTLELSTRIVGPPSLDIGLAPDPNMIFVGSEKGVLYAVEASV